MSRRNSKAAPIQQVKHSNTTLVVVALVVAMIGAAATWLLLPQRQDGSPAAFATAAADVPSTAANLPPAQAALALGHEHYDHQRWAAAAEQYEAALRLGLDNPDVRTDLGNCYRFLGQPQKALEQYERSQRQNPQHENSLFNLASLHAQMLHDNAKAQALINEYLRRFPDSDGAPRARQFLAEIADEKPPSDTERRLRELVTEGNAPAK
jgi:tetratricopeptide (TPR) repeat protein